jgi:hypothetical protein
VRGANNHYDMCGAGRQVYWEKFFFGETPSENVNQLLVEAV